MLLPLNDVDISIVNSFIKRSGYNFSGILTGNGRVANLYETPGIRTSISINDFAINGEDFGRFDLSGLYDATTGGFIVDGTNKYLKLRGKYKPENDSLNLDLHLENLRIEVLEPYLTRYGLSDMSGSVSVFLGANGYLKAPEVSGHIDFNQALLTYDFLQLRAKTSDIVEINNSGLIFKNFMIYDENNQPGTVNGGVYHNNLKDINFDFLIQSNNMKLLNTTEIDNSLYYGTVYATATTTIKGTPLNFGIDVVGKTEPNTIFVLPMTTTYTSKEASFITFVSQKSNEDSVQNLNPIKSKMEYYFKMDIEVTPDAETQIVFDPKVGDLIRGNSLGNIKLEYSSDEELYMYGELEVVEGDYLFTLQNIINKRFHIKQGGSIIWDGDPYQAKMDLDAVYSLRAPLIDLMRAYEDTSSVYRRPTNVDCHMHMSGSLMSPEILFSIEVPNADERARAQLSNMSQDDINKQLFLPKQ